MIVKTFKRIGGGKKVVGINEYKTVIEDYDNEGFLEKITTIQDRRVTEEYFNNMAQSRSR